MGKVKKKYSGKIQTLIYGLVLLAIAVFVVFTLILKSKDSPTAIVANGSVKPIVTPATPDSLYSGIADIRRDYSSGSLIYSSELNSSANEKCVDMVKNEYYAHESPLTGDPGYNYIFNYLDNASLVSENLNRGENYTAGGFITSWMSSASHKSAIIDERYTHIGFAVCDESNDIKMAVMHLAKVDVQSNSNVQPSQVKPRFDYQLDPYGLNDTTRCTSKYYSLTDEVVTTCN